MTTSVALCTFNGEKYISQQLESILNQTVAVDEIIVCDDCSADGTLEILNKYSEQYPSLFRIYKNTENLGYVKNFEKAILLTTKEIILLCDQDDLWKPEKTEIVESFFAANVDKSICAHNLFLLDPTMDDNNYWKLMNFNPTHDNEKIMKQLLFTGNVFPGMSLALRKEVKRWLPLKYISKLIIHDFELIIRALNENKFGIINDTLAFYRLHENQNIGFGLRTRNAIITEKDIYSAFVGVRNTDEIVKAFHLDPQMVSEHVQIFRLQVLDYLAQFGPVERIFRKLKIKYYYKFYF